MRSRAPEAGGRRASGVAGLDHPAPERGVLGAAGAWITQRLNVAYWERAGAWITQRLNVAYWERQGAWITQRLNVAYWERQGPVTLESIRAELQARHSALARQQQRSAASATLQRARPPLPDQAPGTSQQPVQRARPLASHLPMDLV